MHGRELSPVVCIGGACLQHGGDETREHFEHPVEERDDVPLRVFRGREPCSEAHELALLFGDQLFDLFVVGLEVRRHVHDLEVFGHKALGLLGQLVDPALRRPGIRLDVLLGFEHGLHRPGRGHAIGGGHRHERGTDACGCQQRCVLHGRKAEPYSSGARRIISPITDCPYPTPLIRIRRDTMPARGFHRASGVRSMPVHPGAS